MMKTSFVRCLTATSFAIIGVLGLGVESAPAKEASPGCDKILQGTSNPAGSLYDTLKAAMTDGATLGGGNIDGLPLYQWGTIVDRTGVVCAVVYTGPNVGDQWLGSRVISAQKANTANAFSLDTPLQLAISTANLYSATQPGGSLFGLQASNPVDPTVAYGKAGKSTVDPGYGTAKDPMVGTYIGGVNVFGGGLALYDSSNKIIGGLGTSGNTSCADHYISWVVRYNLGLDHVTGGPVGGTDNIVFDIAPAPGTGSPPQSASGWGHPSCGNPYNPNTLITNYPLGH